MELDNFLEHHGIKGMRWGVRRNPGSDGRVGKEPSTRTKGGLDGNVNTSADHERYTTAMAKAKSRGITSLSNEELKLVAARIKTENEFAKQTQERALANRSLGRKMVESLLQKGVDVAGDAAASYGKKLIEETLLGKQKPSHLDLMKKETEALKARKENLQVKKDLFNLGDRKNAVGSGPIKVNPAKVKITTNPNHTPTRPQSPPPRRGGRPMPVYKITNL